MDGNSLSLAHSIGDAHAGVKQARVVPISASTTVESHHQHQRQSCPAEHFVPNKSYHLTDGGAGSSGSSITGYRRSAGGGSPNCVLTK